MIAALRRRASNVFAVAYREAAVLRHDKGFLSTVLAQPVMMILLFGLGLSNVPANVPWAVLDRSQSGPSRRLVEEIRTTGYFLPPSAVGGYQEAHRLLQHGEVLAVLVIPETFRRDLARSRGRVQLLLDGSDPLSSARVGSYVVQVAGRFGSPRVMPAREGPPGARASGPVDVRQRFWFNATLADRNFFLATIAGLLLTNLCLSVTALGIVGERESGTFEQTLALPIGSLEIVLGKLLPLAVVSYGILLFATVFTGVVFGLWPQGSFPALLAVSLPFILASLAIGVFVSALAKNSAQAVFITVFFIMPSFVLSGVMFPYELMPEAVRLVGNLLPLRWYQIALRRLVARGAGFADVIGPFCMLAAIFVMLLDAIRWRLKPRLG